MTALRYLPLALALVLLARPAAAGKGLEPDAAEAKRAELLASKPDDARAAIDHLVDAGAQLGDPELLFLAAEQARDEAERARDEALAREAAGIAATARDIGMHLADERNYEVTDWRPVTRERAASLAVQAEALVREAEELADAIVAERAAAEAEARRASEAQPEPTRARRPGTGLIAGGSAALVIGVGGLGMVGAGVALGQARQREAEALILPDQIDQLDELDRQGAQANAIAFAGIGVATVGLAVGTALIVVGAKRRKAGGDSGAAAALERVQFGGWFGQDGGGAVVGGRF